ncbi:YiiX/YebB-like N1pC/P60 family cysteine hydrolase [Limibacter armeniacum]|uniref:YiiX/YebB-like N1pC/P60 family cysteine hydrolase n=1 Tax=Limibacter armeniacum TaxID=466084 RepID=UPI002FE60381
MKRILILLLTLTTTFSVWGQSEKFELEEGDILFQDLDCGPFCEAIDKVTDGWEGNDYSHCGLLVKGEDGSWIVLEAVGKGVLATPLQDFFTKKVKDDFISIGRLNSEYQPLVPKAIEYAWSLLGKPYDDAFVIGNDKYYCSELIYDAYKSANEGDPIFNLNPMTYNDPETGKPFSIWVDYFKALEIEIPEGKPGLNPGGISRSPILKMYKVNASSL